MAEIAEIPADIPQDVWDAAAKVDIPPAMSGPYNWRAVLREAIARAILAERERCAKIAEGFDRNRDWVPGSIFDRLYREVATSIRQGSLK